MHNLAAVYRNRGKLAEAEPLLVRWLEVGRRVKGEEHLDTLHVMEDLADLYYAQRDYSRAEPLLVRGLEISRRVRGEKHHERLLLMHNLGVVYHQEGELTKAEPLLRESLKFFEQNEANNWTTFNTKSLLGGSLLGQKKYGEAEPLLLAGYEGMRQREGTIPPIDRKVRLAEAIERLVQLYEAWGQPEKAGEWRAKLPPTAAELPADVFARP
jgi:tetratricopeptide (TPR) repeat protein